MYFDEKKFVAKKQLLSHLIFFILKQTEGGAGVDFIRHNHTFYKAKQNILLRRATSREAPSITSKQIRHKKDQVTHNCNYTILDHARLDC